MRKANTITPFGVEVKKKLLELGLTQKEFCIQNKLNYKVFSHMIRGVKDCPRLQQKTAEILGISA